MITTNKQFASGIKTLGTKTAQTRALIQELLITAVFFSERDGDVAPINRVVEAVQETKSYDMWKIFAWLKKYDAPVKPSLDGKTFVFDAKKRHLTQGAPREDFAAYETVMRSEPAWYELAKKEATPADVWDAETGFDNFIKKLMKEGYSEAAETIKATAAKLKREGKMRTLTESLTAQLGEATM